MIFYRELFSGYLNLLMLPRFYKEEAKGEINTYIHFRAKCTGKHPLDVLADVVDETTAAVVSVRSLFSDNPKALEYFNVYCNGYM